MTKFGQIWEFVELGGSELRHRLFKGLELQQQQMLLMQSLK